LHSGQSELIGHGRIVEGEGRREHAVARDAMGVRGGRMRSEKKAGQRAKADGTVKPGHEKSS
jgi:hypothetical protein